MSPEAWQTSTDPLAMIRWLADRDGFADVLWDFTAECLNGVYDELPGESFRRVVRHFREVGVADLDDLLHDADAALRKLRRRAARCDDDAELARLNVAIGRGEMVFALERRAPEEVAADISRRLIEWASDPSAERVRQAGVLRRLVEAADPAQ